MDDYDTADEQKPLIPINDQEPSIQSQPRRKSDSKGRRKSRGDAKKVAEEEYDTMRRPLQYYTINSNRAERGPVHPTDHDHDTVAAVSRYKYYNRLAPPGDGSLHMPDHVVPAAFLIRILLPPKGKQGSLITIFALWNTMMGTSLLSMPWAIRQAGFVTGLVLIVAMAGLMLYTSYRVMTSIDAVDSETEVLEFSDVCRYYMGRWAEISSLIFSLVTLLGGMIVYWILMSNFLYNDVKFIYNEATTSNSTNAVTPQNYSKYDDVYCPHPPFNWNKNITPSPEPPSHLLMGIGLGTSNSDSVFSEVWDTQKTVPFFLVLILAPLLNFKSPTFFTKFNLLGSVSVTYLLVFITVKAVRWGFHLNFSPDAQGLYVPQFKTTFPALTGIAALAYFIQNCVLSVTRNQKHPENNARDLTIAYVLVCLTYFYVGSMMYASFPLEKGCIEDNLLNNFRSNDVMAFVARICLFVQMLAVFPLLVFVFRVQIMHALFGNVWPGLRHVLILNLILMGVCVVFARFLPHIGTIISFVGAFCGFAYAIALPCCVYMLSQKAKGQLTWYSVLFHSLLIIFGLSNFVAQFLILGKT